MSKKNKFYVTTPIYYANSKPHLGTLYTTLLADIVFRWKKLLGLESFFLTGLDEHGQKMQEAAEKANKSPQEFVDQMVSPFKNVWQKYNLDYSKFIRTSSQDHKHGVYKLFEKLWESGAIYKDEYKGLYCTPCETFVNQADVIEEKLCPGCNRELKAVSEESYFFRLSQYQDRLLKFYQDNPNFIEPSSRLNEVVSFVKSGLKDLSITRKSVKWGIPFRQDPEHTIYVWGDALTNYISGIGFGNNEERFSDFWPANLHIIGKDIVRFHAVYWPAILMAAGLDLPKQMLVHGFILMGNDKMSKSKGNVVDPVELADEYGVDQVRYYLARHIPVTQDGIFDIKELENAINSDLANNLGNLQNRLIALCVKNKIESLKKIEVLNSDCVALVKQMHEAEKDFFNLMNKYQIHLALASLWKFISSMNVFFHKQEPWKMFKAGLENEFKQVAFVVANCLLRVSRLLSPIMPRKMEQLAANFGVSSSEVLDEFEFIDIAFQLGKPLFEKVEQKKMPELSSEETKSVKREESEYVEFADFIKVKSAVGKILTCEKIAKSEKLYRLSVDFGKLGVWQVVSGLAKERLEEQLVNKKAAFVINLKPRKIMGLESQAMIMAARDDLGNFAITTFDNDDIEPGSILS